MFPQTQKSEMLKVVNFSFNLTPGQPQSVKTFTQTSIYEYDSYKTSIEMYIRKFVRVA